MLPRMLRLRLPALALLGVAAVAVAQTGTPEDRLRDQLRQTTLQLREAQDENAGLKAKLLSMSQQLDAVQHAAPAAAPAQDKDLRRGLAQRSAEIDALKQQFDLSQKLLAQWQQAYQQAAGIARARDADAKKCDAMFLQADSHARSCDADNAELVRISSELVDRYEHKGVWASLRQDEPLMQWSRIELEKQAQTYHAAVVDHTMEPYKPVPPENVAPAAAPPAQTAPAPTQARELQGDNPGK